MSEGDILKWEAGYWVLDAGCWILDTVNVPEYG
jgi:hypothetical protein